ncbi:MAG: class I SAM-dependent methyltransferase [Chloroflexota bacterium]
MSEKITQQLSGVAKTLLIPLYVRSLESQRPDALIKDENAVALIKRIDYDFSKYKFDKEDQLAIVLRNRAIDRFAQDFITRHPQAVVVQIGCGLDVRFERVDNGQIEWYDLDLAEVIKLRQELIGGEGARYHHLACSVFDSAWIDLLSVHHPRPFLFLAEGVLMYFEEAQVKSLVLTLRRHFPGAELVSDAFSPFIVWANNRRFARTQIGARYAWGMKHGKDLESWGDGIRLLDEWYPFNQPEPRLEHVRWVRFIPPLAKAIGIFHYRLGNPSR